MKLLLVVEFVEVLYQASVESSLWLVKDFLRKQIMTNEGPDSPTACSSLDFTNGARLIYNSAI